MLALSCAAAVAIAAPHPAHAADAAAGRDKAKVCRTCHGLDGVARLPNAATIAGETEIYLVKQLKAFRDGERKDPQMSIIAEKLGDEDIADLAAWYSSIKITVEMPE
jgi:cytochrome c553